MFLFFAIVAMVVTGTLLLLVLFEPGLEYQVNPPEHPLSTPQFLRLLGNLSDAAVHANSRIEVLTDGAVFYESMLAAIRQARRSINLEAYIFQKDEVGRRFIDALAERAGAGVKVNVVIDAIGSFTTWEKTFQSLRDAGGRVRRYQPIRWYTLKRFNNRTHRELLIVDGDVGFIGGAGIGDNWITTVGREPPWRDTMVRVTGDLVIGLQTTFCENWLEAADEILTGDIYFPVEPEAEGDERAGHKSEENDATGFIVISAPSAGRSTRARVLFQLLLVSARETININSPYFLPDRSVRRALINAVRRGVRVRIITPGDHSDQTMTRSASRRRYGELMKGGVEIYEYQPAMIHVKALMVDGLWSVVGSTNFDNRSFGINDEVNLATQCISLASRLNEDFERDLSHSHRVTLEEWNKRPIGERILEKLGIIIERHQ